MQEWEKFRIQGRRYVRGDWDCSKAWYQAHRNCGIAVMRCDAKRYRQGLCGFDSKEISIKEATSDARRGDTVWWSWGKESKRPLKKDAHIGQLEDSDTAYHNSFGRKRVVKDDLVGILVGDLEDVVRRWILKDDPPTDIKVETKAPKKKSFWDGWLK
jgi:hypothetical protein